MKLWILIIMAVCMTLSVGLFTAVATVPTSSRAESPTLSAKSQPARSLAISADFSITAGQDQPKYLLAGSKQAAWIVTLNPAKNSYGLLSKTVGGKWQWRATDMAGVPVIVESLGESLHMVFPQGDYVIYTPYSDGLQSFPVSKIFGKPVAACTGEVSGAPSLIVIVAGNPQALPAASASRPATNPETEPATASVISTGSKLNAYQITGNNLTLLSSMDTLNITSAEHVMPAMVDGTLFVLISRPGNNRLAAWRSGSWRQVELPETLAHAQMLTALAATEGRLVLIYAERIAADSASRPASRPANDYTINFASSRDLGATFTTQPVTQQGRPFTWDQASLPRVSSMAQDILMLWPEKQMPQLATVDPEGRMISVEQLKIMAQPPGAHNVDDIIGYFLWAVVIGIFFTLFMVRPAGPPKPFTLPESVQTASLLKRLLAAIIDFLPFCM
ncbi:MAG: hypothetical protein EHM48_08485, partial [Planctomycetaceae bacterium]